jgi:3-oxoacyl-(acyl-carrier-protein) synthase
LETLAGHPADHLAGKSVGLVMCLNAGCVHYSCRFYEEMLRDPATASPLVFPETVFSALASHVAALFENTPLVYTLVGDSASFLQGVALATQWLDSATVDICIVIGAEEANWLLADALWQLEHRAVLSAGAGAIALTCHPQLSMGVELASITDAHTFGSRLTRAAAAARMRAQLPPFAPAELLCDGTSDSVRASAPELRAWQEWPGSRLSPKRVLGEGLMAAAAWQCVAACAAVANSACSAANLSLVGSNQQAIGARFIPHPSTTIPPQL